MSLYTKRNEIINLFEKARYAKHVMTQRHVSNDAEHGWMRSDERALVT